MHFTLAILALVSALQPFDGNTGWINSKPLTPAALRGNVVLVDFWEYTCVNCLKTLPYERTWYDRYAKYGFTIIGVHTPEFKFSGESANVAAAVKRLGVDWPVVLDSRQTIWDRYDNDVWPRELLFDQNGKLIADHSGEGDYPDMERRIQQALHVRDPAARFPAVMDYLPGDSYSKPGAVCYRHTPEMYLGNWRGDGTLGNAQGYGGDGRTVAYVDATAHDEGRAYVQGPWFESGEALVNGSGGAGQPHLVIRYRALQVVAVLKPLSVPAVHVIVLQDGVPLTAQDAGADVRFDRDGRSYLLVDAPREYDVVMNKHFAQHDLELLPQGPGLGAYTFDFEACEVGADR
jgi:thiol-disulfide isomerase/thioredoxin